MFNPMVKNKKMRLKSFLGKKYISSSGMQHTLLLDLVSFKSPTEDGTNDINTPKIDNFKRFPRIFVH